MEKHVNDLFSQLVQDIEKVRANVSTLTSSNQPLAVQLPSNDTNLSVNTASSTNSSSGTSSRTVNQSSIDSNMRQLFPQLRGRSTIRRPSGGGGRARTANPYVKNTWTREFCCVDSCRSSTTPTCERSQMLEKAGLGKKKVIFQQNDDHAAVEKKLFSVYPRLKNCGGFTLHRAILGGYNRNLTKIDVPWFDVKVLRKKALTGSGVLYIKPLQTDLDMRSGTDAEFEESAAVSQNKEGPQVRCLSCSKMIKKKDYENHNCSESTNVCDICMHKVYQLSSVSTPRECCCIFHTICIEEWLQQLNQPDMIGNTIGCPSCNEQITGIKEQATQPLVTIDTQPLVTVDTQPLVTVDTRPSVTIDITSDNEDNNMRNTEPALVIDYLPPNNLNEAIVFKTNGHMNVLTVEKSNRVLISVRRRNIWNDTVSKLKKIPIDILRRKPIYVDFIGEDGDDFGGLTREFFYECFQSVEGKILQGPSETLSILKNKQKLDGREYYVYGLLVALALLHCCPGPQNLSRVLTDEILGLESSNELKSHICELPDYDLQEKLGEILKATSIEALKLMIELQERYDAGIPNVGTMTPNQLCQIVTKYRLIGVNKEEIAEIVEGLSQFDMLKTMKDFPQESTKALNSQGNLNLNDFKHVFVFEYSDEEELKKKEEDIVFNFFTMLEEIDSGEENSVSYYDPYAEQMIVKDVSLKDILGHLTGSRYIGYYISSSKIRVRFVHGAGEGMGFECNTCEMSLKLPVITRFLENFKAAFIDSMLNSPGFTRY